MASAPDVMEKIVALCRRRGFIFGSSEIYGGIGGFWDYGPLGCELKRNIKDCWWNDMVRNPPVGPGGREYQMVGVDCSIIMNPQVWVASGHATGFSDPMVDCKACKARFRADKIFVICVFDEEAQEKVADMGRLGARFGDEINWNRVKLGVSASVEADSLDEAVSLSAEAIRAVAKDANLDRWKKCEGVELPDDKQSNIRGLAVRDKSGFLFPALVTPVTNVNAPAIAMRCAKCRADGALTQPRAFNLMFETFVGALQDSTSKAYLRPETAQGIFANFKNVMDSTRVKIPFGIAQMGKAFRNEINPRNYTFRSREFEQMEIEFFCNPSESRMWYEFWRDVRKGWYESLNIKSEKLRPREQGKEELAHYSCGTTDIEYLFPFSDEPQELEGVAHRGDFDLKAHGKHSKNDENAFSVFDDELWQQDQSKFPAEQAKAVKGKAPYSYVPHVIEPSAGVDRFCLAAICEAYSFDESRASPEFLKFHPRLAPIKAAVFPLVAKDGLPEVAEPIYREIKKHYPCQYDAKQSIGKRYARMDEAGTPFCFTIDGQTREDGTVTVRNRDDASQIRIDKSRCLEYLRERLHL